MPSVKLIISRTENDQYLVVVNGEGFFQAANKKVGVRVKGDDQWFDDTLFALNLGFPAHVSQQGLFTQSQVVSGSQLNEDWGEDEIYALVDVEGFGSFRTNVVKGHF